MKPGCCTVADHCVWIPKDQAGQFRLPTSIVAGARRREKNSLAESNPVTTIDETVHTASADPQRYCLIHGDDVVEHGSIVTARVHVRKVVSAR